MPKTFGLTYTSDLGKTYRGVAADNHLVYNICGGAPAYTLMVIGATSLLWMTVGRTAYDKYKEHRQNNTNEAD